MKKSVAKLLLISLSAFILTGCVLYNGRNKDGSPKGSSKSSSESSEVEPSSISSSDSEEPSESSSSELPPPPEGSVNIYYVLGPNGLIDGVAGTNIPDKYLENAFGEVLAYGAELPTAGRVTSSVSGSSFSHWIDRATTEKVTTVTREASVTEQVVVAVFNGGEGGNTPIVPDDGLPTSGFGFLFEDHTKENPHYKIGEDAGTETFDGIPYTQKHIRDFTLVKDQRFQLFNFGEKAGWTVPLDPASCNRSYAKYIEIDGTVGSSSSWYRVKETFDAKDIYIKLAYEHDQLYIGKEPEPGELPNEGYGLLFETAAGMEPYFKLATAADEFDGFTQYHIDGFNFVEGQKFQLYNFGEGAGWIVPLDSSSLGGSPDTYIDTGTTWYTVKKDFLAGDVYIKMKYQQDQIYISLAGQGDGEQGGDDPQTGEVPTMIYFAPNANWKTDNPKFAAYYDGVWVEGTDIDSDGVYEFDNSQKRTQVIFVRVDPSKTIPLDSSWTGKWNQTPADGFHQIPTDGKNLATLNTDAEDWNYFTVTWSVKA